MKKNKYLLSILSITLFFVIFTSCEELKIEGSSENKGFFEYEYSYQLVVDSLMVNKRAYKRINIQDAFFVVNEEVVLPDPLPSMGFRQLDLYLFSNKYSETKEMSKGDSYVKIVLVDSLANEEAFPGLLGFNYMIRSTGGLLTDLRPACLDMRAYLNLESGDSFENYVFEKEVTGQLARYVILFDMGSKYYQLLSNGLYDSHKYNFHYVGDIPEMIQFPKITN